MDQQNSDSQDFSGEISVEVERQDRILSAATHLFLEHGYDQVTLDEIVQTARVSKTTIYNVFGSKEVLLQAVVINSDLASLSSAFDLPLSGDIETMLQDLGRRYLKRFFAPRSLAVMRLCLAVAPRFPQIGQFFLENARVKCAERATVLLSGWAEQGLLKTDDAEAAAYFFLQLLRTEHQLDGLYNPDFMISDEEIDADVARAVRIFLISLDGGAIN
jgi:AcrR family transcriptional regulator